jgi:Tol biopolymer transport system component/DNA-binding winged helix-turn-helix (wHTH) protein
MHPPVRHRYVFGPFRLDPVERLLYRDGEVVPLTAKVFDILLVFVENSGRTLEKEAVIEQVWPGQFVEEGNLTRNVSTLRKALGESPDDHRYIVTIPRRGYQFVAEVREVTDEECPSLRSNVMGNGVDESVEAAAATIDQAAVLDGEAVAAADRRMKRPSLLTSPLMLALAASVILLVAVGGLVGWYFRRESTPPEWRAVPLTSYPGIELNPALSPDGNQVAFSWNGEKQDNFDIYIKLIGSNSCLQLTTNPAEDFSPAWSPDGLTIAFLRRLGGGRNELLLTPALGGPERKLAETLIVELDPSHLPALAWSPDRHWLAVSHREAEDPAEGLFLVSALTGEKRRLTRPPSLRGDFMPAFSPDGRTLAFSRLTGFTTNTAVYMLSLSEDFKPTGEAQRLKTDKGWASHPVWTRDGRHILYISGANPQVFDTELRMTAIPDSGSSERVTLPEGAVTELSLGRHLVYTQRAFQNDIWRAEIPPPGGQAGQPQLLISSTRRDSMPRYSPDGKKIAFTSTRSGSQEIWIAEADGSNPTQLTSVGGPLVGPPTWSPDGQRLVFHARSQGQADLFMIPASGGAPKRLTTDSSDDTLPAYSRDGRWIYFASPRSGQSEVWKMPAEGGDATRITSGGGTGPVESPDGKTLYFGHPVREKGIWKMPVQGGAAAQVTGAYKDWSSYAVAAEGIFYVPAADSRSQGLIQFLSFSTGRSRPVVVSDRLTGGLSLSPDRRFLVFVQQAQNSSDLMLIENFVVR